MPGALAKAYPQKLSVDNPGVQTPRAVRMSLNFIAFNLKLVASDDIEHALKSHSPLAL